MGPAEASALLAIQVLFCPAPGQADVSRLAMPPGSTLGDALLASGVLQRHALKEGDVHYGIWGKVRELSHALREHDRVEVYRPLRVDPKEARRQRYKQKKAAKP